MSTTLISIILCIGLTSCFSSCRDPQRDGRNPLINKDEFKEYKPWWVSTNTVSTNAQSSIQDIIQRSDDEYF